MEFNHEISINIDNKILTVLFYVEFKKIDISFDTGLGFNQKKYAYEIKKFDYYCEPRNETTKNAALKKYEETFMQRDIDSIDE